MLEVASELDESFVPKPPGQNAQRNVPRTQPTTDRAAPGR
jgi:hypothetical protein